MSFEPHDENDLRIPTETGWAQGGFEAHLNSEHGYRLTDLMTKPADDLAAIHAIEHSPLYDMDLHVAIADAVRGGCPELFTDGFDDFPDLIGHNVIPAIEKAGYKLVRA